MYVITISIIFNKDMDSYLSLCEFNCDACFKAIHYLLMHEELDGIQYKLSNKCLLLQTTNFNYFQMLKFNKNYISDLMLISSSKNNFHIWNARNDWVDFIIDFEFTSYILSIYNWYRFNSQIPCSSSPVSQVKSQFDAISRCEEIFPLVERNVSKIR